MSDPSTVTIIDVSIKATQAGEEILKVIQKFQEETGCCVWQVNLFRDFNMQPSKGKVSGVKVDVGL